LRKITDAEWYASWSLEMVVYDLADSVYAIPGNAEGFLGFI
jgi:hypothetical protein